MILKGPKGVLRDLKGYFGTTMNDEGPLKVLRGFLMVLKGFTGSFGIPKGPGGP